MGIKSWQKTNANVREIQSDSWDWSNRSSSSASLFPNWGPTALIAFGGLLKTCCTLPNQHNKNITIRRRRGRQNCQRLEITSFFFLLFNEILVDGLRQMRPASSCICHLQQGSQTSEEYDLIPSIMSLKPRKDWFPPSTGGRGEKAVEAKKRKTAVKENA